MNGKLIGATHRDERGVTLLELLIALALFAIVAIGTLGALGAVNVGGFLEGFPVAFATNRSAKDMTAATVYIQGLHEHLVQQGGLSEGTYTFTPGPPPPTPFGFSEPSAEPYQLNWSELRVDVETWGWDGTAEAYANSPGCTGDCLFRVHTTLIWQLKDATRQVEMERFVRP